MSSLLRTADDRGQWAVIAADASVGVPQRRLGITGISYLVSQIADILRLNISRRKR